MARSSIVTVNASPVPISTSLSINVSPTSGNVPITINVISTLYDSAGNPLIGKPIIEYINTIWIGERYSGVPFSMYFNEKEAGIYNFQNKFAGDDAYLASDSPVVTVTLTAAPPTKIATSISISVSPTSGRVPFDITVTGKLVDSAGTGLNNKTINLYSNVILVGTTTTILNGSYAFNLNITAAGTYQFQTEFLGDATYEGCAANNGTIGVTEAGAFTIKGKAFTFPIPPGSVEAVVTVDAVQYKTPFEEEIPEGTKIFKASWNEQTLEEEVNVDKDMTILFLFDPAGILNRTLVLPTGMLPPIPLPS